MKKIYFLICVLFIVCSCAYTNTMHYMQMDKNDKTISLEPGALASIYGKLNSTLRKNGFTVYVKNKSKDIGYVSTKSRYELLVTGTPVDLCLVGGTKFNYVISIVDLKEWQEVFVMEGEECSNSIVPKFEKELKKSLLNTK